MAETNSKPITGTGSILLVEDESNVRNMTYYMLTQLGYKVSACSNGGEAVQYFDKNHKKIDLVLLDIVLPGMNGKEVCKEIRKIQIDIKVLFYSGYKQNSELPKIAESCGTGFLQKPFTIQELSEKIAGMM